MSLKKNDPFLIISIVLFMGASVAILFYSSPASNIMTGHFAVDSFSVAVYITHLLVDTSNAQQLDNAFVNGTNVSIMIPVEYYGEGIMNVTATLPAGFECGQNWSVNESGTIKDVLATGNNLTWLANKSASNNSLMLELPPPAIISEIETVGSGYEKQVIIESCGHLVNVSANISVNYTSNDLCLYLLENNSYVNRSFEYHFQVLAGYVTFSGFNMSNKTFAIRSSAYESMLLQEGSIGQRRSFIDVPELTRFLVEPMSIIAQGPSDQIIETYVFLTNLLGYEIEIAINSAGDFVKGFDQEIILDKGEGKRLRIEFDPAGLQPGTYKGKIVLVSKDQKETVNITYTVKAPAELNEVTGDLVEGDKAPLQEQRPDLLQLPINNTRGLVALIGSIVLVISSLALILYLNHKSNEHKENKRNMEQDEINKE